MNFSNEYDCGRPRNEATQDQFSLKHLGEIVTNPEASNEEKLLAVSVAFESGKREGVRASELQREKTPW